MSARLLDGLRLAQLIQERLALRLRDQKAANPLGFRMPGLAMIMVGEHPASEIYVQKKFNTCQRLGYLTETHRFSSTTSEQAVLTCVQSLNQKSDIDGILIQLPLPPLMSARTVLDAVSLEKDVDGFHPQHTGLLAQARPRLRPCTPYGILALLAHYQIALVGANALVIGASHSVGRPMALELLNAGASVTVCHRQTRNLEAKVASADILIVATGTLDVFDSRLIKKGAVVVDVGIHRLASGRLRGDLAFEPARKRASFITPVPGGVGPMTVAALMYNTYQAMAWREYGQEVGDLASFIE